MEQRPLRLGDIVDDYCPRERRLTNHAIVAIFQDAIQKTRCTTCDAEHVYKQGREPRRRKKEETLFEQVMADVAGSQLVPPKPVNLSDPAPPVPGAAAAAQAAPTVPAVDEAADEDAGPTDEHHPDGWLAHRTLIRAALPKIDGEPPPARPIPEFTMYQRPQGRGGRPFRFGGGGGGGFGGGSGERNGNVARGGHGGGQGNFDGNRGPRRPDGQGAGQGQGGPGGGQGQGGRRRRRHKRPR